MMRRIILAFVALALGASSVCAQELWGSAAFKAKVTRGLSLTAEAEYRTTDGLSDTERWSLAAGVDYKPLKWLKLSAEYKFIDRHVESRITRKGNIIDPYWQERHRVGVSATGSLSVARFTFSLRERYQYTHHSPTKAVKRDGDDGSVKGAEAISAKEKQSLRSRLEVEYNIRRCPVTPFVSAELYNSLTSGMAYEKARYTVGADWKINRHNYLTLFYRYIQSSDNDDVAANVIGIGYKFSLK